jgi:hypothetical protein
MIDDYFENLEKTVLDFKSIIKSYTIFKKAYNEKQGYIKGDIVFANNSQLCFIEVKNTEVNPKTKYRYHYMDKGKGLIFRYDNAYHHKELKPFPNHKHNISDEVFVLHIHLFAPHAHLFVLHKYLFAPHIREGTGKLRGRTI